MGDPAEAPIPFKPDQQSGLEELAGASPVAINVSVDSLGALTLRPGIADYKGRTQSASTERILALHESNKAQLFGVREVGAARRIIRITGTTESNLSTGPGGLLRGTLRPVISETEDRVVAVGGDETVQWDPNGLSQATELGGNPPFGSHILANRNRLLLNDLTQFPWIVWFSDVSGGLEGGYEAWNPNPPSVGTGDASSFTALPNREPVIAVVEGSSQIFAFGRTRMQLWLPDQQQIYVPETALEVGCSAPYSITKVDQNFAWIDHLRRVVVSDGRTYQSLSDPAIQSVLNTMPTVADAFGWRFLHGNTDALLFTFPSDGRTFVYQKGAGWSQWQGWDGGTNTWKQFPVLSHTRFLESDENVVGTSDGRIGLMQPDIKTDFGEKIPAMVVTGFLDRGTSRMKACRAVRITMRRGEAGAPEATGFLWWRDDLGDWRGGVPVGFGSTEDRAVVVRFPSVGGTYRRRQWKWVFSGAPMVLASVTEEYEILGS